MGNSQVKKGNFEGALENFRTAFSLSPQNYIISNSVGMLHLEMKNYAEAKEAFQFSLNLDKNNKVAIEKMSDILKYSGDYIRGLKMAYEITGKISFTDKVEIKCQ